MADWDSNTNSRYHDSSTDSNNFHANCCKHELIEENKHGTFCSTMSGSQKNGAEHQNDLSVSSSSTSSSKSSSQCDNDKKTKGLKSLLKQPIDPSQDFIKSHNKRVKFSETMQVFCYELPDNQMPQIIALKSPAELSLMEFQPYMFEPPAEYRDFLAYEPPPDYRDFIANSLNVFRNEVTFDYIDDDGDDDSESAPGQVNKNLVGDKKANHISSVVITNEPGQNSNWKSMILDNNLESLEEEQIIGVLKEDEILQAIGSQISLPVSSESIRQSNGEKISQVETVPDSYSFEMVDGQGHYDDNLSSEDFPVHHLNTYLINSSEHLDEDDEEACCLDSSPNGSLQDLASDSSITSQDTIILINQNKTFHLESVNHSSIPNQTSNDTSENIYENLQSRSGTGNVISAATLPINGQSQGSNDTKQVEFSDHINISELTEPPDNKNNANPSEVLYENTAELLSEISPMNSSLTVRNTENRLSSSSSEDSKMDENVPNNGRAMGTDYNNSSKFKQNILFYESIVQQNQSNKTTGASTIVNNRLLGSDNCKPGAVVNLQPNKFHVNCPDINHVFVSGSSIPLQLPLYTIVDSNRASSSSSLSSTSSSSSSLASSSNISQTSLGVAPIASNLSIVSTTSSQIQSQTSPSSNSSASSSSSSNLANSEYLVQYSNQPPHTMMANKRIVDPTHPPPSSNNCTNFVSNSSLNNSSMNISSNVSYSNISPLPNNQSLPTQQPQVCLINNGGPNTNGNLIRSGQVIYRYPYAFIQQPGTNGVNTLRPVQYIVQTNPNTGAQSVIYNPRFVVNTRAPVYSLSSSGSNATSSSEPTANCPISSAPNNLNNASVQRTATPQQPQILSSSISAPDCSATTIPVRRILVPQGTTVLAPRIMHLHPQHKQTPPPYQYYVQQRQQQAILTYQQNVQLRPTSNSCQFQSNDTSNQVHTDFPNPSEIRRRDGLYAYPQVLLKNEEGQKSSQNVKQNDNADLSSEERDELEEFVKNEQQRTERIKKRYSFTEDDDPTFGFARRPSVRGIRPKFGSTNEIIKQMTSTISNVVPQQKIVMTNSNTGPQGTNAIFMDKPNFVAYGTLPKNAHFIQVNPANIPTSHPQMISIVKQMGDIQLNDLSNLNQNLQFKSQTLPKHLSQVSKAGKTETSHEIVRIVDASMLNSTNSAAINASTLSRDHLKLQLQKQIERQMQQQQKMLPQRVNVTSTITGSKLVSTKEERGAPEGASFSPNHPVAGNDSTSFAINNGPNENPKPNLVNDSSKANPSEVVYYSLNV